MRLEWKASSPVGDHGRAMCVAVWILIYRTRTVVHSRFEACVDNALVGVMSITLNVCPDYCIVVSGVFVEFVMV